MGVRFHAPRIVFGLRAVLWLITKCYLYNLYLYKTKNWKVKLLIVTAYEMKSILVEFIGKFVDGLCGDYILDVSTTYSAFNHCMMNRHAYLKIEIEASNQWSRQWSKLLKEGRYSKLVGKSRGVGAFKT